jgi:hypothetical protein
MGTPRNRFGLNGILDREGADSGYRRSVSFRRLVVEHFNRAGLAALNTFNRAPYGQATEPRAQRGASDVELSEWALITSVRAEYRPAEVLTKVDAARKATGKPYAAAIVRRVSSSSIVDQVVMLSLKDFTDVLSRLEAHEAKVAA